MANAANLMDVARARRGARTSARRMVVGSGVLGAPDARNLPGEGVAYALHMQP